jgi:uncharacterized cofD-like protein
MSVNTPIKLVAIGGGTGLSTLLKGLRTYINPPEQRVSLTAIVTVTDDGKSSGRLRGEFSVLPPGDIRSCLVALAEDEQLITRLFRHRFPGDGALGGHSLGNLIILALNQISGDFLSAVNQAREILGINARVLPSTLDCVDLVARINGRAVRGQVAIKSQSAPIEELSLSPPFARALPAAIDAILKADFITLGPGSLFTSVIATLLVKEIALALAESRAKKVYICNAMTEADETHGFTAEDHVRHLLAHAPKLQLDYALFNSAPISNEMRERYAEENAFALEPPDYVPPDLKGIQFLSSSLASESRFVRHDPEKLSRTILEVYSHAKGHYSG